MCDFSLKEALEKLHIDPYPTKRFRDMISMLKNITIILKELKEVQFCIVSDIIAKLPLPAKKVHTNENPRLVRMREVYQVLTENLVSQTFNHILSKLLSYIVIKLNRCDGEDAASILHDFQKLQVFIFDYRKYSSWDNKETDQLILMFQNKIIRMLKEFNRDNRELKFHLFSIMRIMIIELGTHPIYHIPTIKDLITELKLLYELEFASNIEEVDVFVFENYLTYLHIINELIGSNLLDKSSKNTKELLLDLKKILSKFVNLNKTRPREIYLIGNILNTIELYLK